MGEIQNRPFQLSFHAFPKVGFQGSRVTSDGGLILVRDLDERFRFGELIVQHLAGYRGKNAQLGFAKLPRQSVYSRLAGYEDLNDSACIIAAGFCFMLYVVGLSDKNAAKRDFNGY